MPSQTSIASQLDAMKAEGYVLITEKDETKIIAASASGLFYGAQTLKQLIRTDGASPRVHLAVIRDWPAMKYRGIQDDLSRGPVRTLEFQKKQSVSTTDPTIHNFHNAHICLQNNCI